MSPKKAIINDAYAILMGVMAYQWSMLLFHRTESGAIAYFGSVLFLTWFWRHNAT